LPSKREICTRRCSRSSARPFATALQLGRAALFEDTGLGKVAPDPGVDAPCCAAHQRPCLLLVPLAVAHQFVKTEAPALGLELAYCRSQAEADASSCRLIVTNYEMASRFDASQFAGVALDEADIISNFVGKTNRLLTAMFSAHTLPAGGHRNAGAERPDRAGPLQRVPGHYGERRDADPLLHSR
jgi:hypothetical protein